VDWAYEFIVETDFPGNVGPRSLGSPYEVVAAFAGDSLIQSAHLDRWLTRCYAIKHEPDRHDYIAGEDEPGDPRAVSMASLVAGLPAEPWARGPCSFEQGNLGHPDYESLLTQHRHTQQNWAAAFLQGFSKCPAAFA